MKIDTKFSKTCRFMRADLKGARASAKCELWIVLGETAEDIGVYFEGIYRRFKMEGGDNKVEIEIGKDKKSYAGIPEADFVVSAIY